MDATDNQRELSKIPPLPCQSQQQPSKSSPEFHSEEEEEDEDDFPVESELGRSVKMIMFSKMAEVNSKNVWLARAYTQVEKSLKSVLKNIDKANDLAAASRFLALRRLLLRTMKSFKKATIILSEIIQTCHRLGRLLSWIRDYVQLEGDHPGPVEDVVNVKELDNNFGTIANKFIVILGQILESIEGVHQIVGD